MEPIFNLDEREKPSLFTIRDLVGILFKHKHIIISSYLVVTLLVALGLMSLPLVYTSTGKILVKIDQQGVPDFFSGLASYYQQESQSSPANRKMETELELVETRPIAEKVVRDLNLTYWDVYHKPYVHLLAPVADFLDSVMSVFGVDPDPQKRGFDDTVKEFLNSFEAKTVKSKSAETTSNIVEIKLKAPDKQVVAKALQKLMEVYRDHDALSNQEAGKRAYDIVKSSLERSDEELQKEHNPDNYANRLAENLDLRKRLSEIGFYLEMSAQKYGVRDIIEPAHQPRESSLKKDVLLGIIGSFAGLVFGIGIAGFKEFLDHTIESEEELRRLFDIDVLGSVNQMDEEDIATCLTPETWENSPASTKFRKIIIRLLSRLQKTESQSSEGIVVYITSAEDGEGKSFVAEALALHAAAITANRILLIDSNMENPGIHEQFSVEQANGFSDVLVSRKVDKIEYRQTAFANLDVLPAGESPKPGLLFSQHIVEEVLADAKTHYDLIIVDGASIIRGGANCLAGVSDGILLVTSTATKREKLLYALSELDIDAEKIVGDVLNNKVYYIPDFIYRYL